MHVLATSTWAQETGVVLLTYISVLPDILPDIAPDSATDSTIRYPGGYPFLSTPDYPLSGFGTIRGITSLHTRVWFEIGVDEVNCIMDTVCIGSPYLLYSLLPMITSPDADADAQRNSNSAEPRTRVPGHSYIN